MKTLPRAFDADLWEWADERREANRSSRNKKNGGAYSPFTGALLARIGVILQKHLSRRR